jgi:hypothetical protein
MFTFLSSHVVMMREKKNSSVNLCWKKMFLKNHVEKKSCTQTNNYISLQTTKKRTNNQNIQKRHTMTQTYIQNKQDK